MDNQRSDLFWGTIVPSVRLDKARTDATIGGHTACSPLNHGEEPKGTQSVVHNEKTRPEPTTKAQPAHHYISLSEHLKRIQDLENNKHAGHGGPSEGESLTSSPGLGKGKGEEVFSGGTDDTAESDGDSVYEDDGGSVSDASDTPTTEPRLSHSTPRRARTRVRAALSKPQDFITMSGPKRKTKPFKPASTNVERPKKSTKIAVKESEGNDDGDEDEEAASSVPDSVNRSPKARAKRRKLSILPAPRLRSRNGVRWSRKEEEAMFRLRRQGRDWKYIADVLGRTASGIMSRWDLLRAESQKSVEARKKWSVTRPSPLVIAEMAKIPRHGAWTEEEDEILINLRAQGRTLKDTSNRIRGRTYEACRKRWLKIKHQYPQLITATEEFEWDGMGHSSVWQGTHSSGSGSQPGQEAEKVDWTSPSATIEGDDPGSSTRNGLPIDAAIDTPPPVKKPCRAEVGVPRIFVSAVVINNPKPKPTGTDHLNRQAARFVLGGEDPSMDTRSPHSDQWELQSVIARGNPKAKEKKEMLRRWLVSLRKEQGM